MSFYGRPLEPDFRIGVIWLFWVFFDLTLVDAEIIAFATECENSFHLSTYSKVVIQHFALNIFLIFLSTIICEHAQHVITQPKFWHKST